MRSFSALTLSALLFAPLTVAADPCPDVVRDTVAEMRAGADGWWSQDAENLIRAAAGSACIKAQSGRYGSAAQTPNTESQTLSETAVSEQVVSTVDDGGSKDSGKSTEESATGSDAKEEGSWSLGGLTFSGMSGSPGQKPYERRRQTKEDEGS
ncbi:hypothetical protein [Congregibacter sp.]|uniref:hypothetical protein n=1 Tax=Congregibacter sp. TaxID=2744308 RepID=UPI003F6CBA2B